MKRILIVWLLLLPGMVCFSSRRTLYLSAVGDDAASGDREHPLASLSAAIRTIRTWPGQDTVYVSVAPGTYYMTETVAFGPGDTRPVVFEGEGPEPSSFYGGIPITGWQPTASGVWWARVPQGIRFEQLYVNGRRAVRARTPNAGWFEVRSAKETVFERGTGRAPEYAAQTVYCRPEDLVSLRGCSRAALNDVVAMFYHKWDVTRKPLQYACPDSGYLCTVGGGMKSWNPIDGRSRYVLENYREALDEPGEWFLSREGELFYMPRPGEEMDRAEVLAPLLNQLICFRGNETARVENKQFRNLTFSGAAYTMPASGNEPSQAAAPIEAAVMADFAGNIVFQDCEISRTGGYALWFRRECHSVRVEHCLMTDLGAGGIKIGDISVYAGRPVTSGVTVDNCIIQHAGSVFPCGIGVGIFHASDNRVTHNEISDLRYSGVSVGWVWGYGPSEAVRNEVSFNHIHHIGWGELSDMGAVYTLGVSPGTRVTDNVIHDVYAYSYGGWGLYTDEGSTGVLMENNLVYGCKNAGFHQHYGKENTIRNNIFAFGQYAQLQFTRVEPHESFSFTNNIVLGDCGEMTSGNWADAQIDMDRNCYWDLRSDTVRIGGRSFAEWQQVKDRHSVVADPGFRDPTALDFTFRTRRTIKKIGFRPFDYNRAGVYGSDEWKARAQLSPEIVAAFEAVILQREKEHSRIYGH